MRRIEGLKFAKFERRFAKDKIRFAVAQNNGLRSAVWSAWGHKSDFYLGIRCPLGSIKISLHASRICRVALTKDQADRMVREGIATPEQDRALFKWTRAETPQVRAILVASVIFPTEYLRHDEPINGTIEFTSYFRQPRQIRPLSLDFSSHGNPQAHSSRSLPGSGAVVCDHFGRWASCLDGRT